MRDYSILVKVRNGRIRSAMQDCGIESASELARLAQVSPSDVGKLINLKELPLLRDGSWRPVVIKIATALNKVPDELFSERQLQETYNTNEAEKFVSENQIDKLLEAKLRPAISYSSDIEDFVEVDDARTIITTLLENKTKHWLSDKDKKIVMHVYFEGNTLDDVSKKYGISRERVRQRLNKSVRKMRAAAQLLGYDVPELAYDTGIES